MNNEWSIFCLRLKKQIAGTIKNIKNDFPNVDWSKLSSSIANQVYNTIQQVVKNERAFGRHQILRMEFTKEQYQNIIDIANSGEKIPLYALLASDLGKVTKEDIEWAQSVTINSK